MQIQRPALWLFKALGIISGINPQRLEQTVSPVLDIGQGGMGQAVWSSFAVTRTTTGISTIVGGDVSLIRIVWLAVVVTAGATASSLTINLQPPVSAGAVPIWLAAREPVPVLGQRYTHTSLAESPAPFVVPPGWALQMQSLELTASGQTHEVRAIIAEMPVGYKPW